MHPDYGHSTRLGPLAVWWGYPLHRAASFIEAVGMRTWFYGVTIGRLGIAIVWRDPNAEKEAT